jgi:hypothetical protein
MSDAPSPPDETALLEAARRHLPGCRMVGMPLRLWRQRPSAKEDGLLDLVQPALGWAVIAWGARGEPLGLLELHADGVERALSAADLPWLTRALHLALAELCHPELHAGYVVAFDAPGTGVERAVIADLLLHELVVPLQEGAQVLDGPDFAAWLQAHGARR